MALSSRQVFHRVKAGGALDPSAHSSVQSTLDALNELNEQQEVDLSAIQAEVAAKNTVSTFDGGSTTPTDVGGAADLSVGATVTATIPTGAEVIVTAIAEFEEAAVADTVNTIRLFDATSGGSNRAPSEEYSAQTLGGLFPGSKATAMGVWRLTGLSGSQTFDLRISNTGVGGNANINSRRLVVEVIS